VPALDEEPSDHEQERRDRHPERGHVEPREGHVRSTDLERDQVVGEHAHQQRHDGEEHHERAVHGDQGVIKLGQQDSPRCHRLGQHTPPRHGLRGEAELPAHHHRQQPADEQAHEAHHQELDADDLVVGREDVLADERQLPGVPRARMIHWPCNGRHKLL
jgi:hypothetical protein